MKMIQTILYVAAATTLLALSGCATNNDTYVDEEDYSNTPSWSTPQSWEAAPNIPGLSGSGY